MRSKLVWFVGACVLVVAAGGAALAQMEKGENKMTAEEMKSALVKMNDSAWHTQDLDAAYEIYSDDVVFRRVPFPPVGLAQCCRLSVTRPCRPGPTRAGLP